MVLLHLLFCVCFFFAATCHHTCCQFYPYPDCLNCLQQLPEGEAIIVVVNLYHVNVWEFSVHILHAFFFCCVLMLASHVWRVIILLAFNVGYILSNNATYLVHTHCKLLTCCEWIRNRLKQKMLNIGKTKGARSRSLPRTSHIIKPLLIQTITMKGRQTLLLRVWLITNQRISFFTCLLLLFNLLIKPSIINLM